MAIMILALAYVIKAAKTADTFMSGTTMNGVDVSGMNAREAEAALDAYAAEYTLTVAFRGSEETLSGSDINFRYAWTDEDGNDVMSRIIRENRDPLRWYIEMMRGTDISEKLRPAWDRDMLESAVGSWEETDPLVMEAPADARVGFEDGDYVIIPETEGSQVIIPGLIDRIEEALSLEAPAIDTEGLYEEPVVRSDDPKLVRDVSSLNELIPVSVTYDLPDGSSRVLEGMDMTAWLVHNEMMGGYVREDPRWESHISDFVDELAEDVDTVGTDFTFEMTGGGTFTETSFNYGWMVDRRAERQQLAEDLAGPGDVEREPLYSVEAYADEGIGDTYIEVDLTRQHLWVYEDGVIVKESDVMSGRLTRDRYTPAGVYRVFYTELNRILVGDPLPGSTEPEYRTLVHYWMEFRRSFGLHDNYWRSQNAFGGTYYVRGGSHGCINLPTAFAAELFPWVAAHGEVPVLVYYSGGDPFPDEQTDL